jgi:putative DNA primase/helicase
VAQETKTAGGQPAVKVTAALEGAPNSEQFSTAEHRVNRSPSSRASADNGRQALATPRQRKLADEFAGSARRTTDKDLPDKLSRTDLEIASQLVEAQCDHLRFVPALGWVGWYGKRWEQNDDAGKVAAVELLRGMAENLKPNIARAKDDKTADAVAREINRLCQARTVRDVAELARIDPLLRSEHREFDADPMVLNCQNCVIDLKTGMARPHNPADRLTKLAAVDFVPDATCPTWERTIARVFGDDTELIAYWRKIVGLCLTGLTGEQALFFMYGSGRNGKTTIVETVLSLLGDYAVKLRAESILMRNHDGIPNDIAALRGARFVVASELPQGRQLNESLVKDLTGGDTITARLLYREGFSFSPTFKLVMYGNHKPEIKGGDDGIWRRVRMLPFEVQIPENEVDKDLPAKLRAELPGILNWALAGLKSWQREGLASPVSVKAATESYRAEEDVLQQFISEFCVTGPGLRCDASDLYAVYENWAKPAAESPNKFGRALTAAGFRAVKGTGGARLRAGIGLLADYQAIQ